MLHSKHFSLSEANGLLDKIKPKIEEMVKLKSELDKKNYDIFMHQYFGGIGPNGTGKFPEEMEKLVEVVEKISSNGIIIKGIGEGLIDFPHIRRNGEEVYLCWKLGEDGINFWHSIHDGFAGRKSVDEL